MNANVRRLIDLGRIYIKGIATSGKIPTLFLPRFSVIGFASRRRTWGTGSRKNLIKACLVCQSIRRVSWAVKKVSTQAKVMCDEHRLARVMSRSSFLPEEPERRISRGYCRGIGPKSSLSTYILGLGPNMRM